MPAPRQRRARTDHRLLVGGVIALAVTVLLAIAVVGAGDDETSPARAQGSSIQVSDASAAQVGDVAPQLIAQALDGAEVRLPAGRPSAVFFFAGWCGTCVPEAAALGKLQREHGSDVAIVAVDVDPGDTAQMIEDFLAEAGNPTYPVVHDVDGALRQAFNVASLDVTVITDEAGRIVYRDAVPSTEAQLRDGLRRAGARI
jgi:thiol-disulfide isomerase/thioredoxin